MLRNKTILWIDNDLHYVHLFSRLLRDVGYNVLTAATITEAKKSLATHNVDLVLTDIMIPTTSEGGGNRI